MTNDTIELEEESRFHTKGFVSAYLHEGSPVYVWMDKESRQGYLKRPTNAIREHHLKNLIVNKASVLMAKRMRPGASWGAGITHLEVGTGVGTGNTQAPEAESASQTTLRSPLARKDITAWTYIDSSGNPTETETNVVEFSVNFTENEAIGALVEMGLFGGDASNTLGTGYMFNYKVFSVWNKQAGMQLTVTWRITF